MAFTFTDENVEKLIADGQPVVIDFWATWCGPCVAMGPVIDEVAKEYEGRVLVGKYNIEEGGGDFSTANRIMSIPAILFFKDGKPVKELRLAGSQPREKVAANIEKLMAM